MADKQDNESVDDKTTERHQLTEETCLTDAVQRRVSFATASRFRKYAIAVSWLSVVFPLASGVAAIVLSSLNHSQTLFGYGLDALLDSMSSAVVIWRFFGSTAILYSPRKERMACIIVAILFFVAAFCLTCKSIYALVVKLVEHKSAGLLAFAVISGVISLILGTLKVYLGYELESRVLLTDSVITYTGAAVSLASCISMLAFENDSRLWVLDPVFGIMCSCFLAGFGMKLIIDMVCNYKEETKPTFK